MIDRQAAGMLSRYPPAAKPPALVRAWCGSMTPRSRRRVVARCTVSFATPSDAASDRTDTAATTLTPVAVDVGLLEHLFEHHPRRRTDPAPQHVRRRAQHHPTPNRRVSAQRAPRRSALGRRTVARPDPSSPAPSTPTAAPADTAIRDGSPAAPTSRPTPDTRVPADIPTTDRSATPRSPPTPSTAALSTSDSDGTTCSDDDIVDQNYTHDIHTARPHPPGPPDGPDATVTNGHSADTSGHETALPTRSNVTGL